MAQIETLMREWQKTRAPVMTARTVATNRAPVDVICDMLGSVRADQLTTQRVELFRNMLLKGGMSKITAARYLSTLRAGCNGYLDHIPMGKLIAELKREPVRVDCWTRDEVKRLLHTSLDEGLFWNFLKFLFATGCRRGEALALQQEDIDWDRKRLHIHRALTLDGELQNGTKWGGERWIPMAQSIEVSIPIIEPGFVFPRWDQRVVGTMFAKVREKANVRPFKLHCTRHTAISWALSSGMSLRKASEIFGVSQGTLESHYAHYVEEEVSMEWANL